MCLTILQTSPVVGNCDSVCGKLWRLARTGGSSAHDRLPILLDRPQADVHLQKVFWWGVYSLAAYSMYRRDVLRSRIHPPLHQELQEDTEVSQSKDSASDISDMRGALLPPTRG